MKKVEMDYVLCKICKDWADEFYCEAFAIMPKNIWNAKVSEARKAGSWDCYFGTNEGWEEISFGNWQDDIEVISISESQAKDLIKLLKIHVSSSLVAKFGTGSSYIYPEFDDCEDDEEFREGDDL